MIAATTPYRAGRAAVIERAEAVLAAGTAEEPVARYRRRRRRRTVERSGSIVPETRAKAIRRAASLVMANHALLDAAIDGDTAQLDADAERIEAQVAADPIESALARFTERSLPLLERCEARPDLEVGHVYPMARTANDIASFVAVELHLVARMLDPAYAPPNGRELMRLYNGALRPVLGHGLESWAAERVKPWRGLVVRRGLAWP